MIPTWNEDEWYCTCKEELDESWVFCPTCGLKIEWDAVIKEVLFDDSYPLKEESTNVKGKKTDAKEFKKQTEGKFFCPETHIMATEIASTPIYIREWFKLRGKKELLENEIIPKGVIKVWEERVAEQKLYRKLEQEKYEREIEELKLMVKFAEGEINSLKLSNGN